jgi:hypothetical protein
MSKQSNQRYRKETEKDNQQKVNAKTNESDAVNNKQSEDKFHREFGSTTSGISK